MFGWGKTKSNDDDEREEEGRAASDDDEKAASAAASSKMAMSFVNVDKTEELAVGFRTARNCTALVTGSSGLCGARLVEMLLERGARRVICFDIAQPDDTLQRRFDRAAAKFDGTITICSGRQGDLTSDESVDEAFAKAADNTKIDVCFHIGALVGPFFDREKYMDVNYHGTVRIIAACRKYKVRKLVYSSSPSTRFTGGDVTGQTEDELPMPDRWLAMYAEAKAYGEMAVSQASAKLDKSNKNDNDNEQLLTVSIAPHQIYGPYDNLFLKNLLETAGNGRLRIFGKGRNRISVCYVDNYVHGLLCGADALTDSNKKSSAVLGKFYIVTDGPPRYFWDMINEAVVAMGFCDLNRKWHLPVWLLYLAAYLANVAGWILGRKFKLNPFNVKMLTIHRYFSIERAKRDLQYEPVVPYEKAWPSTIQWFKEHWLPQFLREKNNKTGRTSSSIATKSTAAGSSNEETSTTRQAAAATKTKQTKKED